ncbi:Elongation of very long chain fatty acids 4, partial [Paramuricea clavata]
PRTKEWLLVPSILSPLSACLLYLFVVKIGPKFMEKRQPFELRIPMAIYNLGATALSLYCFTELFIGSWKAGYHYICQRVIVSMEPQHLRVIIDQLKFTNIWWGGLIK